MPFPSNRLTINIKVSLTLRSSPASAGHRLWSVSALTSTSCPDIFVSTSHSHPVDMDTPSRPMNTSNKTQKMQKGNWIILSKMCHTGHIRSISFGRTALLECHSSLAYLKSLCLGQKEVEATKPMGENQQDVNEINHSPEIRPNRTTFDDVIESNGAIHLSFKFIEIPFRFIKIFHKYFGLLTLQNRGNLSSGWVPNRSCSKSNGSRAAKSNKKFRDRM